MTTRFIRTMQVPLVAVAMLSASIALTTAQAPQGGAPAQGAGGGRGGGRGPQTPPLIMTTTAWEDGGVIPDKYTQAAGPMAVSPELKWTQVPPGTQSFVLLMHDPEPVLNKGSKMDITHWLIWNIPATSTGLQEARRAGRAARTAAVRSVSAATVTWAPARLRVRIITTRSSSMLWTPSSRSRRARRSKPQRPGRLS